MSPPPFFLIHLFVIFFASISFVSPYSLTSTHTWNAMKGFKSVLRCDYGVTRRFYLQTSFRDSSNAKRTSRAPHSSRFPSSQNTNPLPTLQLDGLFAVYKPPSWTSNDVVTKIRNLFRSHLSNLSGIRVGREVVKLGHGGTLDPLAEGVLVLGIGSGTKLLQGYLKGGKTYQTIVQLGTATEGYDSEGAVTETKDCSHVTESLVQQTLPLFRGEIEQIPPMYSALRVNGSRLYDLARKGIEVTREARKVTVYRLEYLSHPVEQLPHSFCLEMEVSGGFYVRSLIHDLAIKMDTVGHMKRLIRTQQGPFGISDCLALPDWTVEKITKAVERNKALLPQQMTT